MSQNKIKPYEDLQKALAEVEAIIWAVCEPNSLGREKMEDLKRLFSCFCAGETALRSRTGKDWAWFFYNKLGYRITDNDEDAENLKKVMDDLFAEGSDEKDSVSIPRKQLERWADLEVDERIWEHQNRVHNEICKLLESSKTNEVQDPCECPRCHQDYSACTCNDDSVTEKVCPHCHGRGKIESNLIMSEQASTYMICQVCKGSGNVSGEPQK